MNLRDFIFTALTEIDEGINEAVKKTKRPTYIEISGADRGVGFDVAVTIGNEGTLAADGQIQSGVKVGVISVLSGQVNAEGNVKAEGKHSHEEVSRIKFRLFIDDRLKEEEKR